MADSDRILIVRLSALGDVIHSLPLLHALRRHLPRSHIAWLVEPLGAQVLAGHPELDELVRVERGWLRHPGTAWQLRRRLRASGFTVTFDPQGLTKSALPAWLSGAASRVGFTLPDGRELSRILNNRLVTPKRAHVVERNLELLAALDLDPFAAEPEFVLPRDTAAEERISAWIAELGTEGGYAVINPGAGWPSKLWPRSRYAEVAKHLGERHGLRVIVSWAGKEELGWAREIAACAPAHAVPAPPTSIPELTALLRMARLCIGSDTGPLHLAAALGRPSVGLYGPMPAARNGLYGPCCVNLQEMEVKGSKRARRGATNEAMRAIETRRVCAACDELLQHHL